MKTYVVLIFAAFVGSLAGASSKDGALFYCGDRLPTALNIICEGNFIKRAEAHHINSLVWITQDKAKSLGRSKRPIVSECCEKPCTINELKSYCRY